MSLLLSLGIVSVLAFESSEAVLDVQVLPDDGSGHVHLSWSPTSAAQHIRIYRRERGDSYWSYLWARDGTHTDFLDPDTQLGVAYEYRVEHNLIGVPTMGTFVMAGHEVQPQHLSGLILLVVSTEVQVMALSELEDWVLDVESEGWAVSRVLLTGTEDPVEVKALLTLAAGQAPEVSVLLVGQVPVPYAGLIAPDSHEDHYGAWPADGFYAEHDGNWTDASVNETRASRTANHNTPGDGKFDQSEWPSDVDWMIGRLDLSRLPVFSMDEAALYRRYFEKNHAFRTGQIEVNRSALIDDNFGFMGGEAFAATAWGLSPVVGRDAIKEGDWLTDLSESSWLWGYGCGGGSYTSANGVGTSTSFAATPNHAVFGSLFGSYFGDWDTENNLMRSALATEGALLTMVWSGRPRWFFHGLAMDEPIGVSVRRSQNNTYYTGYGGRSVHAALLGDPTLRSSPRASLAGVRLSSVPGVLTVEWEGLPTDADGVFVYAKSGMDWQPLHEGVWTEPVFSVDWPAGVQTVGVRPARLAFTPSGSVWRLGLLTVAEVDVLEGPGDLEPLRGCACATSGRKGGWTWLLMIPLWCFRSRLRRVTA